MELSKCCKAPANKEAAPFNFTGDLDASFQYVCSQCGKPCEVEPASVPQTLTNYLNDKSKDPNWKWDAEKDDYVPVVPRKIEITKCFCHPKYLAESAKRDCEAEANKQLDEIRKNINISVQALLEAQEKEAREETAREIRNEIVKDPTNRAYREGLSDEDIDYIFAKYLPQEKKNG